MENQWHLTPQGSPESVEDPVQHLVTSLTDLPQTLYADIGSVNLKTEVKDAFGDLQGRLTVLMQSYHGVVETSYRLGDLQRLPQLTSRDGVEAALQAACLPPTTTPAEPATALSALLPGKIVAYTSPLPLMALDLSDNSEVRLTRLLGERLVWMPDAPLLALIQQVSKHTFSARVDCLWVHRMGCFVFGDDPEGVAAALLAIIQLAEQETGEIGTPECTVSSDADPADQIRSHLATLRHQLSEKAGVPLLMHTVGKLPFKPELIHKLKAGPLFTFQATLFGSGFLTSDDLPDALPAGNIIFDESLGLIVTAQTPAALTYNTHIACALSAAALAAWEPGEQELSPVPSRALASAESPAWQAKDSMFEGEIALVTGAASGIGRGCALALLKRGAAVIGLDINPDISQVSDSPGYLGIVCDLSDEAAVSQAMEATARHFGGLDMVVLNAGIFPKSAALKEMDLALWQRVMQINLNVNVTVLRESYPLLKVAPQKGRVLVNASRNVPAPGPCAGAYSTSKAALTQMARVAALEWGPDGIRVNMIHPHAVFDTGIWTDEVLRSRAEKYGLTVEAYKTNNLLRVELTSHDVGELVCEMLGPVFSKTTGAQVPVDGGSDRVI